MTHDEAHKILGLIPLTISIKPETVKKCLQRNTLQYDTEREIINAIRSAVKLLTDSEKEKLGLKNDNK